MIFRIQGFDWQKNILKKILNCVVLLIELPKALSGVAHEYFQILYCVAIIN